MATLPAIAPISNEDLTTKVVNGTGIFDELMTAAHAHLDQEWGKQRITGTQYAEVYLGQMTAVLQQSVVFLVQRDAIYLNNLLTQAQIDKASAAQPTNMANTTSELDSMRRDIDELDDTSSSSIDDEDDLPF